MRGTMVNITYSCIPVRGMVLYASRSSGRKEGLGERWLWVRKYGKGKCIEGCISCIWVSDLEFYMCGSPSSKMVLTCEVVLQTKVCQGLQ